MTGNLDKGIQLNKTEKIVNSQGAQKNPEQRAMIHAQNIVRRHALAMVWPQKNSTVKSKTFLLAHEIAQLFRRQVDDVSLKDIERTRQKIEKLSGDYGITGLRWGQLKNLHDHFQAGSQIVGFLGHIYWIGNLSVGNFEPAVRKAGVNYGGLPLARAAGIWLVGQAIIELYWDPKAYQNGSTEECIYHAIFDGLTLEHYRELSLLMGIDARISWPVSKLREEILSELKFTHYNKVTALWSETPSYFSILLSLCEELQIPNYSPADSEQVLEARLVQSVLATSVESLTPEQLAALRTTLKKHISDDYWQSSTKATLIAGGLVAGRLSGFGLYAAASTSLVALTNGLGLSFAWTTFSTLNAALSTLFGPVGIGLAALQAGFHFTKPRPKKTLPFVLYIAATRGKLESIENTELTIWDKIKRAIKRLAKYRK